LSNAGLDVEPLVKGLGRDGFQLFLFFSLLDELPQHPNLLVLELLEIEPVSIRTFHLVKVIIKGLALHSQLFSRALQSIKFLPKGVSGFVEIAPLRNHFLHFKDRLLLTRALRLLRRCCGFFLTLGTVGIGDLAKTQLNRGFKE
jgi:hypothetical protein